MAEGIKLTGSECSRGGQNATIQFLEFSEFSEFTSDPDNNI